LENKNTYRTVAPANSSDNELKNYLFVRPSKKVKFDEVNKNKTGGSFLDLIRRTGNDQPQKTKKFSFKRSLSTDIFTPSNNFKRQKHVVNLDEFKNKNYAGNKSRNNDEMKFYIENAYAYL
jgi:hypothetical protein